MEVNTKSVKRIPLNNNQIKTMALTRTLKEYIEMLNDELNKRIAENKWIEINKGVYYFIPEDNLLMVNSCQNLLKMDSFTMPLGLNWIRMVQYVAEKWFVERRDENPMCADRGVKYLKKDGELDTALYIYCDDTSKKLDQYGNAHVASIHDSYSLNIPIYKLNRLDESDVLFFLIKNGFNPFEDDWSSNLFNLFNELTKRNILLDTLEPTTKIDNIDTYYSVREELKKINMEYYKDEDTIFREALDDAYCLEENVLEDIKKDLLSCDKARINMEEYPEHILRDPESGHWDLWDNGNSSAAANISESLVARNPVYDALNNKNGVIGIDFGTKSTVVMYKQSRADVLPMRIGSGQFSRAVSKNDYENPTVMELRNVRKFMEDYRQYEGRPYTFWEDLLISHEAYEQLKSEQSRGDTFASYFSELKQWASDKTRQIRLRDLQGNEINIPPYLSLSEDDFDPIEIYAYYLGLFINNMVHKIYLRYKLSFPATVEKQVRDKILNSFTRGIKKSLPKQVLEDGSCMRLFKVEQGASEPAAYAITALCEYGFDPDEGEKFYYGIFDFGGGTTDFDFGVWRSEENEPENYDYQISHFGQGGDPYLGGENLLGILSYHVFLKNYDKLLRDKIVFIRPYGEKEVPGKDYLINPDSQYAQFNHKRMMEKLRGVWEGITETRELFKSGSIALPLFDMEGELKENYSVEVDIEELDALLENRIDKGVEQFFDALKNCFGVNKNHEDIHDVDGINIFLAGNSSKSPVVYKIFKKYIDAFNSGLAEREGEEKNWFRVFPPLGTILSDEILKDNLKPVIDDIILYLSDSDESEDCACTEEYEEEGSNLLDLNKPTGKTGVAYGLLNNRVRVIQNESEEIEFRYFIGQNRKNKFYCVIDKDAQKYNVWSRFCTASRDEFDIWFTRSATAPSNKMPIDQIGIYSETGFIDNPDSGKSVYIRLVAPTEIEYVVANEEEIHNTSYDNEMIQRISLQEKQ